MNQFRCISLIIVVFSFTNCQQRNSEVQSNASHPSVSVLSYNTYLLAKGLNNYSGARLNLLPESIIKVNADIVLLQEVWHTKSKADVVKKEGDNSTDKETVEHYFPIRLIEQLSEFYPYHAYHDTVSEKATTPETQPISLLTNDVNNPVEQSAKETIESPSKNIGTGLVIFSKTPLKNIKFEPWTQIVDDNELNAIKGTLFAETEIPSIGTLQLFNSHTSPKTFEPRTRKYEPEHIKVKNEQIQTLIDFMNNNKNENHCQVLGIDINSHFFNYDSDKGQFHQSESTVAPIFSKLVNTTELVADTDPEAVIKNNTPIESYATWNNKNNALVLRGAYQDNPISKLDFVFSSRECTYSINSKLVFQEKFTMHSSSYTEKPLMPLSDHYGVLANIFFNTNKIQRKSFF